MKFLLFMLLFIPAILQAQSLGDRYFWCDTLVLTTTPTDTTWDTEWEVAAVFSDTLDCYLKVGAPDYGSWTSRHYFFLPVGLSFSIGPTPKLKRLEAYVENGTCTLYIIGYKTTRQY